jgi:hypothetical protein
MSDTPFPILGTTVAPMVGRTAILQRMIGALAKPAPDHLQVIGSRFAGKTVLLHALAAHLRQREENPYTAVLIWDLGHQTPATDQAFLQRFARELAEALKGRHEECASQLTTVSENPFTELGEIFEYLNDGSGKVLALLDGFDKPLAQGGLTRNLWDQLRELASNPSLRLVTASRRRLSELVRHPDAQTSDFWNIFNAVPVRVGCFDDADLNAICSSLPGISIEGGARTELLNATNGFPILTLSVLNTICNRAMQGAITPHAMRTACDDTLDAAHAPLEALWKDCSASAQDLFRTVLAETSVSRAGIAGSDVETLLERGFVQLVGNKLERANRLLGCYLAEEPNDVTAFKRLFGSKEAYDSNLKSVLERRVGQLVDLDSILKRYLERGIEDLPEHPESFLRHVRGIEDRAFELVWDAELPDRRIPSEWMSTWKYKGERRASELETTFPQGGRRLLLLDLMTGDGGPAKRVTRSTYALLSAVHGLANFGQHQEGASIEVGTAYAVVHLCVELAALIASELYTTR